GDGESGRGEAGGQVGHRDSYLAGGSVLAIDVNLQRYLTAARDAWSVRRGEDAQSRLRRRDLKTVRKHQTTAVVHVVGHDRILAQREIALDPRIATARIVVGLDDLSLGVV